MPDNTTLFFFADQYTIPIWASSWKTVLTTQVMNTKPLMLNWIPPGAPSSYVQGERFCSIRTGAKHLLWNASQPTVGFGAVLINRPLSTFVRNPVRKKKAKQAECTAFRFYYITFIWKHYTKYSHQQKFRPQEQYQLKRITVQLTAQKALRRVCENCPELPHSWYTKLLLMTKLPLTTLSPNKSALQVPHDITLKKY